MRPRNEDPKLIIRVINFELVQPICSAYRNVTDRRTDGRTDGRTTYDSNTALALRASRGKKNCLELASGNRTVGLTVTAISVPMADRDEYIR